MGFCEHNIGIAEYFLGESYILCHNAAACCLDTHEVSCHEAENGAGHEEQGHERENTFPLENVFHTFVPSNIQIISHTLRCRGQYLDKKAPVERDWVLEKVH